MAIYEFQCESHHVTDIICRSEERPATISCEICNSEAHYVIKAHANTPGLFGDCTGKHGINGVYDQGLGAHYRNGRERDAIAKSKGLVPVSELGEDRVDSAMSKQAEDQKFWNNESKRYRENVKKFNGDDIKAAEATWPVHEILKN